MGRGLLWTVLCVWLLIGFGRIEAEERQFLVMGDVHFNPCNGLSGEQFRELNALPAEKWGDFLGGLKQPIVALGADTNGTLLDSAMTAAAKRVEKPAFILFTGDFLGHDWVSNYNGLAPQSVAEDPEAYREFTVKTLQFIGGEFQRRFPGAVVLPTLGNEDAFCQDYWVQPQGEFLKRFAATWRPHLGRSVEAAAFERSFSSLGCYVADLPGLENHRLVVLNSVFLSGSYCRSYHEPGRHNCCGCTNPGVEPGRAALAWLDAALEQARIEKKTVWLLMHVPPGLDSHKEDKAEGASLAAGLWKDEFLDRYLKLVAKYESILQISFAGHTHMDDYRIDRVEGTAALLHKIVPSVSPVFHNNPGFQVYRFNQESGVVTGWQTCFLNLAADSTTASAWSEEYDARQTYGLSVVDAAAVSGLFQRILDDPAAPEARAYRTFFRVSAKAIPESHLAIYRCAVLNAVFTDYRACLECDELPEPFEVLDPSWLRRQAGGKP